MSTLRLVFSGLEFQRHYRKRSPIDKTPSADEAAANGEVISFYFYKFSVLLSVDAEMLRITVCYIRFCLIQTRTISNTLSSYSRSGGLM